MSHRTIATLLAVTVLWLGAVSAVAQTDPPRTAWGQPDLHGVWDFRTITPLQRPERLSDQEFLTAEEAANLDQAAYDRNTRLYNQDAERTTVGENVDRRGEGQAPGSYNQFWIDSGTKTVGTRRTSLIIDPPNGRMPSTTPDGQRRAEASREYRREHPADSYVDFSAGVRCILGFNAGPPFAPSAYNNNMQLFQTQDHVVIMTEMVNTSRVIPIDGGPHLPETVRQWSGDSRGHWEGDTLVIETTNFDAKRRWRNTTESMHLIERLTRVDAETLLYEFTVTDPETWTSSWTAAVPMPLNPEPMFEFACHEGNYSMPVMLGGTRAEERAAAGQQ
jgi:hypothetical protein